MATLTLPKPDDNELLKFTGHSHLKTNYDVFGDAMWDEGETFRLFNYSDLDFDTQDDQGASTFKRWYDQNVISRKDDETISIGGETTYFNKITGETEERTGKIITAQEANEKYGLDGRVPFDRDITVAEAQILHERKLKEMQFQQNYALAEGFLMKSYGIAKLGGSAMLGDPVNLALLFNWEPLFTKLGFLGRGVKTAAQINKALQAARITKKARFSRGFKQALVFTGATEVPIALQKYNEKADYTVVDSLINVTFGSAVGGGLHVVGGKTADWLTGVSQKRHAAALDLAFKQALSDQDIEVDALIRAVKTLSRQKTAPKGKFADDYDAADLQRAYNEQIGYVPPKIEYKPTEVDEGPTVGQSTFNTLDFDTLPGKPLFEDEFNVTSGKLGSNDGNTIVHKQTGEKWYIKKPKDIEQGLNEMVASTILRKILGERAPEVNPVHNKDGKFIGIASKWKEGKPISMAEMKVIIKEQPEQYKEFLESWFTHAWLANRDFAAPGNLIKDSAGNIHSIDAGGSLKYRAMGEKKTDFNVERITEFMDFLMGKNADISVHMENLTLDAIKNAITKIYSISDDEIRAIVQSASKYATNDKMKFDVEELAIALMIRRDNLADQELMEILGNSFSLVSKYGKDANYNAKLQKEIEDFPAKEKLPIGEFKKSQFIAMKNKKLKKQYYKEWATQDSAFEYINKQIKNLKKNLTSEEESALRSWADQSLRHSHIKEYLNGTLPKKHLSFYPAKHLLSAIEKTKTQDNIMIHSGKKTTDYYNIDGLPMGPVNPEDAAKLIGQIFTSESVINGALAYRIGKQFAEKPHNNVKFRLMVPKGTNMTFADKGYKSATSMYNETEVLLPPKTSFKIVGATKGRDLWYIDAELQPKNSIQNLELPEVIQRSVASYHKSKHGPVTADVQLSPKQKALNVRERMQKIESNTENLELQGLNKEIDDLTEELAVYKKDSLDTEVKDVKKNMMDQIKESKTILGAAKAVLGCVIGKS